MLVLLSSKLKGEIPKVAGYTGEATRLSRTLSRKRSTLDRLFTRREGRSSRKNAFDCLPGKCADTEPRQGRSAIPPAGKHGVSICSLFPLERGAGLRT